MSNMQYLIIKLHLLELELQSNKNITEPNLAPGVTQDTHAFILLRNNVLRKQIAYISDQIRINQ